jgi:hypothetical protein
MKIKKAFLSQPGWLCQGLMLFGAAFDIECAYKLFANQRDTVLKVAITP